MIIYEKIVSDVRHLFGNYEGNIPKDTDSQVKYVDADGDEITPTLNDSFLDAGNGKIRRKSDNKIVNVQIKDESGNYQTVIGEVVAKKISKIEIKTKPTKLAYEVNDTLDLTGLAVDKVFGDGDKADCTSSVTTSPASGATLSEAGSPYVTVTLTDGNDTFTTKFKITVA